MSAPHMQQVKASAGSGKTHYLTQRFLSLLAQSPLKAHTPQCPFSPLPMQMQGDDNIPPITEPPSASCTSSVSETQLSKAQTSKPQTSWGDIMAVTFTNLAAKEMKERVLKSLKELALHKAPSLPNTKPAKAPPIMDNAKAKAWIDIILRQYSALNIRTIDSLLHLIVRTSALDLGLAPDFETSFNNQELMDPILDTLLEQAEYGDARMLSLLKNVCQSLLYHKNIKGFMVGGAMVEALYPLAILQLTQDFSTLSPYADLEALYSRTFGDFQNYGQTMLDVAQQEGLQLSNHALGFFQKCAHGDVSACTSAYVNKTSFDQCLLKASKGKASALAEKTFFDVICSVKKMQDYGLHVQSAMALYPFVELSREISQKMLTFTNQEQKLAHAKIPHLAKNILEFEYGVSTALCRLGNALQHVLLDEFQDTDREQWDALRPLLIETLSHGGSFTWVGDVKQAIYGWRGGDAALFDEVLHTPELTCMCTPNKESLPTNWRSRETIVTINNTLFSALSDPLLAEAVLSPLVSSDCPHDILKACVKTLTDTFTGASQKVKEHAQGGYVRFTPVPTKNMSELDETLYVLLQDLLLNDLAKRRSWGHIAILVRKNEHAALMAQWLLEWNIPAITENSLLLHTHPLIEESVAFLHFLNNPQDDLHFWTLLTGSFLSCALRPAPTQASPSPFTTHEAHTDAMPCVQQEQTWQAADDAWDSVKPTEHDLQNFILQERQYGQIRPLYLAFKEKWPHFWQRYFAPFYGKGQLLSPYNCMQEWYSLWKAEQRFTKEQTFLRRFLEIIYGAEQRGHATLGTFLDYWEKEGTKEKAPTPSNLDAVHIMTVHKSKGLQFPVVIIPRMNLENRDKEAYVVHEAQGLHMLIPRTKLAGQAYYAAQAQQALEALNVFYVACTRAQEELYFFHASCETQKRRNFSAALDVLFEGLELYLPLERGYAIVEEGMGHATSLAVAPETHEVAASLTQDIPDMTSMSENREQVPSKAHVLAENKAMSSTACLASVMPEESTTANISGKVGICEADKSGEALDFVDSAFSAQKTALDTEHATPLMSWLPRLKIFRDPLKELLLHSGPSPKNRGLLMHHCLEILQSMWQEHLEENILQDVVRQAIQWGIESFTLPITSNPALEAELQKALLWYAQLPEVQAWAQKGLPEQGLIDATGKLYRVDLLLPPEKAKDATSPSYGWRVIEFKSGQENSEYAEQVCTYLQLLDTMTNNTAPCTNTGLHSIAMPTALAQSLLPPSQGLIIYLDLQICRMVSLQQGLSKATTTPQWQGVR